MVTRTIGRLPFSELDPRRFEMLCLDMIYRMRRWERIDHYGALGSDDGVDIQTIEVLENGKKVKHHFQCKRYEKMNTTMLRAIVKDYVEKNGDLRPDYYYIVCGCDVSKKAYDAFEKCCKEKGFHEVSIWTSSVLEARLYAEYHDLLYVFFGVNLSQKRTNKINAIRRNIALKKRMQKDFFKPAMPGERRTSQKQSFISPDVLIRSIYDSSYPEVAESGYGWFKTEVFGWYHNGLMVYISPYRITAEVKHLKPTAVPESTNPEDYIILEEVLEIVGCIPFERIIDYDLEGDEYYRCPHIYCDFERDPYEDIRYYRKDSYQINRDKIVEGAIY